MYYLSNKTIPHYVKIHEMFLEDINVKRSSSGNVHVAAMVVRKSHSRVRCTTESFFTVINFTIVNILTGLSTINIATHKKSAVSDLPCQNLSR